MASPEYQEYMKMRNQALADLKEGDRSLFSSFYDDWTTENLKEYLDAIVGPNPLEQTSGITSD